jgi:ParB family transcriptional regulator, chromosome partitioning protein
MTKKLTRDYGYFSASTQVVQAEQELTDAQEKIKALEILNSQLQQEQLTLTPIEQNSTAQTQSTLIAIAKIDRDPDQCRRWFDPVAQDKLTATIQEVGFRGTLWVRPGTKGRYQLVAGERRLRSAIAAGLKEIPVDILEVDDNTALTLSLLENLQREDLNPVEETEGILKLISRRLDLEVSEVTSLLYKMKNHQQGAIASGASIAELAFEVEAIFKTVGRISWLSFVTTRLPLLNIPNEVLEALRQGRLEYTKARVIGRVPDPKARQVLLDETISESLSLSEIRLRARKLLPNPEESLKEQFQSVLKQKTKAWENPKKMQKIQALLGQLETLLTEE